MNKLLIIGGTGHLGQYIVLEANSRGLETVATYHDHDAQIGSGHLVHLDITDEGEVVKVIREQRPDGVILTSGLTDVDHCQNHPQEAWAVNVEGTLSVAATCKLSNIPLMYISTDAVFNGEKAEPYYEFDTPDPPGIYAQTKLEGERLTLDANYFNCVCRVSSLYGWNVASEKPNFVTWALKEMRAGRAIDLYEDRKCCPTFAPHCAKVLVTMLAGGAQGIYHTSGPECLDRYQMGLKVAEVFDLDPGLCRPVRSNDRPVVVRRGKNLCLSVQKAEAEFDLRMMRFEDGLRTMRSTEPADVGGEG